MSLTTFSITQIAGWMCFALVIGGVVTLAALAAHDAQRAANRSVRWVWFLSIIAIVGLSALAPWRQSRVVPIDSLSVTGAATVVAPTAVASPSLGDRVMVALDWTRDVMVAPFTTVLEGTQRVIDALPFDAHVLLSVAWLLASLGTAGAFALSYRRNRRRMQRWPLQQFEHVAARISPSVGPAVMGLAPSEIVLPSWLLSRPQNEQRLVLAHESEHVRARDPWLLVVACGAVALMPWHPALWFALGRLRLAIELDCDRRVLRQGIPAASYGALLIDLSALRPALPSAMPAFSCSGSYLERRLVAMTARRSRFAASRRILGAVVAVAAMATACESKLPTSAEIDAMDATSATTQAGFVAMVDTLHAVYVVDGKKVSSETAKAIGADDIVEVRIVGKGKAAGTGEIHLRTKDGLHEIIGDSVQFLKRARELEMVERKKSAALKLKQPLTDTTELTEFEVRADQPGKSAVRYSGNKVLLRETPSSGSKKPFDGLLVIDGVISESSDISRIQKESIATVEVVKGSAATSLYSDPRAANGVIRVTTKKP